MTFPVTFAVTFDVRKILAWRLTFTFDNVFVFLIRQRNGTKFSKIFALKKVVKLL